MLIIISGAGQRAKDGKGVMANNKVENIWNFFFQDSLCKLPFCPFSNNFYFYSFSLYRFSRILPFLWRKTEWWWSFWQIICKCIFPSFLKWRGNISAPGFANWSNFIDYMASWSWGKLNQIDWLLLASQDFAPWTALTKTVMMIICCEFSFAKAGKF